MLGYFMILAIEEKYMNRKIVFQILFIIFGIMIHCSNGQKLQKISGISSYDLEDNTLSKIQETTVYYYQLVETMITCEGDKYQQLGLMFANSKLDITDIELAFGIHKGNLFDTKSEAEFRLQAIAVNRVLYHPLQRSGMGNSVYELKPGSNPNELIFIYDSRNLPIEVAVVPGGNTTTIYYDYLPVKFKVKLNLDEMKSNCLSAN